MSGFEGLRVLALESRRAPELAKLIANYGGEAVVAPSMREVPLESNTEALAFAVEGYDCGIDHRPAETVQNHPLVRQRATGIYLVRSVL